MVCVCVCVCVCVLLLCACGELGLVVCGALGESGSRERADEGLERWRETKLARELGLKVWGLWERVSLILFGREWFARDDREEEKRVGKV